MFQQVKKSVKELKSSIPDNLNITERESEMLSYIAKGYNFRLSDMLTYHKKQTII